MGSQDAYLLGQQWVAEDVDAEEVPVLIFFPEGVLAVITIINPAKYSVEWFAFSIDTDEISCRSLGEDRRFSVGFGISKVGNDLMLTFSDDDFGSEGFLTPFPVAPDSAADSVGNHLIPSYDELHETAMQLIGSSLGQ